MRDFNYSYLKDIKWDSEILGLVSQIHEYKGRQELYLKQKSAGLDKLTDIAKIQSTEASNKIEGIVTGTLRLKQLFREKTTPKNRDEQEILGYRDVLNTILYALRIFCNSIGIYINIPKNLSVVGIKTHRIILRKSIPMVRRPCFLHRLHHPRHPGPSMRYVRVLIEHRMPVKSIL